jgi:hypothetical protein
VFVFCFLLIDFLSQNPLKPDYPTGPIYQTEYLHLRTSLHFYSISTLDDQQPPTLLCVLPQVDKINLTQYQEHFKLIADNILFNRQYIFLQKAELSIIPFTPPGCYYQCLYIDTEEPPILS